MENWGGERFDVIVVGGGVMGSSAAYQISKRGHSCLLLEQFDFLHPRGSSHGESRTIRTTYPEPYYSPLVTESSRLWEEAEAESGYRVLFKARSHLDMGPRHGSGSFKFNSVISNCALHSVPHRVLGPSQVLEEFSGRIQIPEDWAGLVTTGASGVLKPTKAVAMFQALALKNGAVLRDNTEVVGIERETIEGKGGIVVVAVDTIAGGMLRFCGSKCVLTVGAWMKRMVERVVKGPGGGDGGGGGVVVVPPIEPLETSVLYWRIKEGVSEEFTIPSGFPTFATYGNPSVYGTPSLEFPGLIKIAVHGGITFDPEQRPWSRPTETVMHSLKEWIEERFGGRVDTASGPVMVQSCVYSMSPDEDFVIDFLGGEFGEEVVVAGGFSGHGFKMAPVVGRIVTDLVLNGEAKGVDLTHFKLSRFRGSNLRGNVKDFEDQVANFL